MYRTYHAGGRSAAEHVDALLQGEPIDPETKLPRKPLTYGGARSEDQWRREFTKAGLDVKQPPVWEVEVGIDRIYGAHRRSNIIVFDDLVEYLAEKGSYSRVVDAQGEPTEEIEDKSTYHIIDAERYIGSYLFGGQTWGQDPTLLDWLRQQSASS